MAVLTVRNLPDDIHRALRVRAAENGCSTEAEVRRILAQAVKPEFRLRLGDAIAALSRESGVTNDAVEALCQSMDRSPARPVQLK